MASRIREGFIPLPLDDGEWRMAGRGGFRQVGPNLVESDGGPGVFWYPRAAFTDFSLVVDWRLSRAEDNSGIFLRIPALAEDDPDRDWRPAVEHGYEIQIDDRGFDPEAGTTGSPRHRTGAIYGRAAARALASHPVGQWNTFEIEATATSLRVRLNGVLVSELVSGAHDPRAGHLGLQAHHPGSRVQFRRLQIKPS